MVNFQFPLSGRFIWMFSGMTHYILYTRDKNRDYARIKACMGQTKNIIQIGRNKPDFIPTMGLCSKRRILLYRLGRVELLLHSDVIIRYLTWPHIFKYRHIQPLYVYLCTIQIIYTQYTHSRWKLEILLPAGIIIAGLFK